MSKCSMIISSPSQASRLEWAKGHSEFSDDYGAEVAWVSPAWLRANWGGRMRYDAIVLPEVTPEELGMFEWAMLLAPKDGPECVVTTDLPVLEFAMRAGRCDREAAARLVSGMSVVAENERGGLYVGPGDLYVDGPFGE